MFPASLVNFLADDIDPHIRAQYLRHCYTTIGVLILLYDGGHHAAGCQTGSIQGMDKL